MSMSSSLLHLPAHLQVRLGRLRADPEFQELLRTLPEPHLPRFKRSRLAGEKSQESNDYESQKEEWVFASGMREGHALLLAHFGIEP
jgi:hypothetical protein